MNQWQTLIKQGRRAYQHRRYSEAERQLCLALKIAEQFGDKDTRLVVCLSELAVLYKVSGDLMKADEFMKRAVSVGKRVLNRRELELLLKREKEILRATINSTTNPPVP